jgi:hypothetical protein
MATGKWIEAKRAGKCANCKSQISEGDQIFNARGAWLCTACGLVAENTPDDVVQGGLEEAALKDLCAFPDEAQDSTIAKAIIFMAHQLDMGYIVGPRDVSNYTKEIRVNMLTLRDLYPPDEDDDATDMARKQRERRNREQNGY